MNKLNETELVEKLRLDHSNVDGKDTSVTFSGKSYPLAQIFEWAINGVTGSRVNLAQLYFSGELLPQDKDLAINILENEYKSVPNLLKEVKYALATYYHDAGYYDDAKAIYIELENINFAPAISRLATMHKLGEGLNADSNVFEVKMKKAMSLGHVRSRGLLALHYMNKVKLGEKTKGLMLFIINLPLVFFHATFNRNSISQLP